MPGRRLGAAIAATFLIACGSSSETSPTSTSSSTISSTGGSGGSGGAGGGACSTEVVPSLGVVVTDHGALRGAHEGSSYAYRNIPFAAPPIASLRWKAPAPAACWSGERDATTWGPMCPQLDASGTGPVLGDEDCLQLNVFVPAEAKVGRPVMFFIPGGGNVGGSATKTTGDVHLYDGSALAAQEDVVVVTTNYRVGNLGFFAHPDLASEDPDHGEGNYGLLDLVAALHWVQTNVASFGGDASRVTIFGQSAGGENVCALVASPLAMGLFVGAIMESGGCVSNTVAAAEAAGQKIVAGAKCDGEKDPIACMRALSADAIVDALTVMVDVSGSSTGYSAVVDGHFLTKKPLDVLGAGHAVPMIIGSNSDETSRSVPIPLNATEEEYTTAIGKMFPTPSIATAVLGAYPVVDYPSPWAAYVAVTTDKKFTCGARNALDTLATAGTPAYRYYFSHVPDGASGVQKQYGAFHGAELPYVFGEIDASGASRSAGDVAVSSAMMRRWASFAAHPTDPSGGQSPTWPRYTAPDGPYLHFDDPLDTAAALRKAQCDFWENLLP